MTVFLCGIPASGKSTFGRFLRDSHCHDYIDMELQWPDADLHRMWNRIFEPQAPSRQLAKFLAALDERERPVCLDWGFPVEQLWVVSALREAGCRIVWFQCDEQVARARIQQRGRGSLDELALQLSAIRASWPAIVGEAQPQVVPVLHRDGTPKTVEELYQEIFVA